jgi:hypothetical protein
MQDPDEMKIDLVENGLLCHIGRGMLEIRGTI